MAKLKKQQKAKILQAVMQAHVAGIQKGKQAGAAPPMGPPAGGPPGAPPPPMGMKAGGKVEPKEKWVPPWAKKGKKFAVGGSVRGGKGDGCCQRGRTKGRMM